MKCECLLSDSKVIESRKDDLDNMTYRGRKCLTCGSMRVTVEMDYMEMKTSKSLPFVIIPWDSFKLAELKRTQKEYEKIEDCLLSESL